MTGDVNSRDDLKVITGVAQAVDGFLEGAWAGIWCQESDRVKLPSKVSPMGLWFRGQANAQWRLRPGAFRSTMAEENTSSYCDETSLFHHFRLRQTEFGTTCGSTFDWLALMQHHGLPTRLLDWTESLLVGLYFAVAETALDTVDGKLFVLDARRLNQYCGFDMHGPEIAIPEEFDSVLRAEMALIHWTAKLVDRRAVVEAGAAYVPGKTEGESEKIVQAIRDLDADSLRRLRSPIGVFPKRDQGRMTFQSSMFTLHGGKRSWDRRGHADKLLPTPLDLREVQAEAMRTEGWRFLEECLVPADRKAIIRDQLWRLGIHEGSLFPEADYQARFIKERWTWPFPTASGRGDP